jgi:hypothetical protein
MTRTGLIRLGGLVAMVGGVASATLGFLYVLQARGVALDSTEKAVQKAHYESTTLMLLVVGVLAAIAALHVIQRESYGPRGSLSSLAAFAGLAMVVVVGLLGGLVPAMPGQAMPLVLVGLLAVSAGVLGLGIVTITAGVLPRWCGVALVAGSPPFVFVGFMAASLLEASLGSVGLRSVVPGGVGWGALWAWPGAAWALVGFAIFRAGARQAQQASRVRLRRRREEVM